MFSRMALILSAAVLAFISGAVNSLTVSDQCLNAICKQESDCRPRPGDGCAIDSDGTGQYSCGLFQIKNDYFTDCKTGPKTLPDQDWKKCANDKACATICVENYMSRYGEATPACQALSAKDPCEAAARIHNESIGGCEDSNTKAKNYYAQVKQKM